MTLTDYWDPYGFSELTPAYQYGSIDVGAYTEFVDEVYIADSDIYLGSSSWSQFGEAPEIYSIVPAAGNQLTLGQSGTLQITGAWLTANGTDESPSVSLVSGSALSLGSPQVVNDSQLNVSYTVSSNPATVGAQGIVVTTTAGTSNTYYVTVGDPTPAITSINPSPWNSGQQYLCAINIQGSGFGTNPSVQITSADGGNEVASYSVCSSPAPTDTSFWISVATNTIYSQGAVYLSAISNGYNGNSFQPSQQGNSNQSPQKTVPVNPSALPVPQLWFTDPSVPGGSVNVTNGSVSVYVGQQISLTTQVTLPQGATPATNSWAQVPSGGSTGMVVAGYSTSAASGTVTMLPTTVPNSCQTQQEPCLLFYWVDNGTWQWNYTYTYAGQNASATVTFNVFGPVSQGQQFAVQTGAAAVYFPNGKPTAVLGSLGVPVSTGQAGIVFSTSALPAAGDAGTFQWVQTIQNYISTYNDGGTNGVATTHACTNPVPGLDTSYPYGVPGSSLFSVNRPNDTASDNPEVPLSKPGAPTRTEVQRTFQATMYLMWDPSLPAGCAPAHSDGTAAGSVPSQCTSIPIPLASVSWRSNGDAINTLWAGEAGTTWITNYGPNVSQACVAVQPGTPPPNSFPTWVRLFNTTLQCN